MYLKLLNTLEKRFFKNNFRRKKEILIAISKQIYISIISYKILANCFPLNIFTAFYYKSFSL